MKGKRHTGNEGVFGLSRAMGSHDTPTGLLSHENSFDGLRHRADLVDLEEKSVASLGFNGTSNTNRVSNLLGQKSTIRGEKMEDLEGTNAVEQHTKMSSPTIWMFEPTTAVSSLVLSQSSCSKGSSIETMSNFSAHLRYKPIMEEPSWIESLLGFLAFLPKLYLGGLSSVTNSEAATSIAILTCGREYKSCKIMAIQ